MTMHTQHPDTHDNGLADDCERCAEHAADPFHGLDDANLSALVVRTQAWMRDEEFPRSNNETVAMRVVETAILRARKIERLSSDLAPKQITDEQRRWIAFGLGGAA